MGETVAVAAEQATGPPVPPAPSPDQPRLLTTSLTMAPHQLIGLKWLQGLHRSNANGILADEMGLGKTAMALAIVAHYQHEWPVLVVAPPVLLEQWASEIVAWVPSIGRQEVQIIRKGSDAPSALAKFVLVSYSLLVGVRKNNQQSNGHLRRTARGAAYQIVVADEAHAPHTRRRRQMA